MNITEARAAVIDAINRCGVRAALGVLGGLTGHRFTALYRFDDPTMHNLYFYDRESPETEGTDDFPVEVTYCVYVREAGRPFVLEDALHDARTTDHPSRNLVRAYCGVPLVDHEGRTFGTMCHFDCVPVRVSDEHADLMEAVAPLFVRGVRLTSSEKQI